MKTKFAPSTFATALLAVTLGSLPSAQAGLLTYEGYTGYTVNSTIVGDNGGSGWGSAWNSGQADGFIHTVRNPTTIAYPGYNGTTTPAASGGNYQNLAAGFGGANPSGVFRALDTSAGGGYGTGGLLLSATLIGADNTTLWGSLLYSDDGGQNSTATLTLNGGGSFATNLPFTAASNLLVFRMDFRPGAADTVTLFSNPNLATFNGTTGGVTTAAGDYSFNTFVLTETLNGGTGAQVQYDDIRFGTTLADVAPTTVPEPSTYLLTLLGAAATFAFGKKSRVFSAKGVS